MAVKTVNIASFMSQAERTNFDLFCLLQKAEVKEGRGGKFLSCTLRDSSGTIDAKAWDYQGPITAKDEKAIVKVRGTLNEYQGVKQMIISNIRLVNDEDEFNKEDVIPCAPIQVDELCEQLAYLSRFITDDDYAKVCGHFIAHTHFSDSPAAKSVHHDYIHGLLQHSIHVAMYAKAIGEVHQDCVNMSLLLTGALIHDIGKLVEFEYAKCGLVNDYSRPGKMMGHLVLGAMDVEKFCAEEGIPEEKKDMLCNILLSHHGKPEYGAAALPMTVEAEIIAACDMLNMNIELYRTQMLTTEKGQFSDKNYYLGKQIYNHE